MRPLRVTALAASFALSSAAAAAAAAPAQALSLAPQSRVGATLTGEDGLAGNNTHFLVAIGIVVVAALAVIIDGSDEDEPDSP